MFEYILLIVSSIVIIYLFDKYFSNKSFTCLKEAQSKAKLNRIQIDARLKSESFKIEYNEDEWKSLRERLEKTRWFEGLDKVKKFEFGFDVDYAKKLVDYWKNEFDWKQQVNLLNKYPHYRVCINETLIHYIRVSTDSLTPKTPILMISGWPGSFFEFYKSIDLLMKANENLDIIVASIPGYGYSYPLTKPINMYDAALLFDGLMRHVHSENVKYFIHGEDWGSMIGELIAKLYPLTCAGVHLTIPVVPMNSFKANLYYLLVQTFPNFLMCAQEKHAGIEFDFLRRFKKILRETGYMHLQATKPDTLGHALTNSPVGLMAYILEKYSSWSFNYERDVVGKASGGLDEFNSNDLLTIVTLYWMTNTITSSMRFYKCIFSAMDSFNLIMDPQVSIGIMFAQNEIEHTPLFVLKEFYKNIKQFSIIPSCGHFAAFHRPELFCLDFLNFINKLK